MPKSKAKMNKILSDYRKSLGLVLCQLWVTPEMRDNFKAMFPAPILREQPKDYIDENNT